MEKLYGFDMVSPIAFVTHQVKEDDNALWFTDSMSCHNAMMFGNIQPGINAGHSKCYHGVGLTLPCPTVMLIGEGETKDMTKGEYIGIKCCSGPMSMATDVCTQFQTDLLHFGVTVEEDRVDFSFPKATKEMENRISHFQALDKYLADFPKQAEHLDLDDPVVQKSLMSMFGRHGYMYEPQNETFALRDSVLKQIAQTLGPHFCKEYERFREEVTFNAQKDTLAPNARVVQHAVVEGLDRFMGSRDLNGRDKEYLRSLRSALTPTKIMQDFKFGTNVVIPVQTGGMYGMNTVNLERMTSWGGAALASGKHVFFESKEAREAAKKVDSLASNSFIGLAGFRRGMHLIASDVRVEMEVPGLANTVNRGTYGDQTAYWGQPVGVTHSLVVFPKDILHDERVMENPSQAQMQNEAAARLYSFRCMDQWLLRFPEQTSQMDSMDINLWKQLKAAFNPENGFIRRDYEAEAPTTHTIGDYAVAQAISFMGPKYLGRVEDLRQEFVHGMITGEKAGMPPAVSAINASKWVFDRATEIAYGTKDQKIGDTLEDNRKECLNRLIDIAHNMDSRIER